MKRNFVQISSLILAVTALISLFNSNAWAVSTETPLVISKKIAAQPHNPNDQNNSRETNIGHRRPALKPKSEITFIPGDSTDEITVSTNILLVRNTPPKYDPKDKINPFQPLFKEKPLTGGDNLVPFDTGRTKTTALEQIDLSQLKLTGIILAASGNKGLVQESSGRGHVIAKGTYIGTRGGRVTGI
jgi:hypothetical protein